MRGGKSREEANAGARAGVVLALLVVSVILNYIDRSNLSIAAPQLKDELGISPQQLGWLLSAFFWTYALCQIPAGWLIDRFDVKYVFAGGFALWSVATAVTGRLHTLAMLFAMRILLGVGESIAFPSYSKIMPRLFPEERRGFANALISTGLATGPALGFLFGGELMARFGWRPFFVVLGAASLVWLLPWLAWMPRAPRREEVAGTAKPGYLQILQRRDLWGVSLCLFCANYTLYFTVTWLPYYLERECGLTIAQMSRVGAAYFFALAISAALFGRLSDAWIREGRTPTRVRKGILITSYLTLSLLLLGSALTQGEFSIALLVLGGATFGAGSGNIWVVSQRLAGQRVIGRWAGIQNFWGSLAGAATAAVTGYVVQRTGHFVVAFFLVAIVLWMGAASWAWIVGPIEPIDWERRVVDEVASAV
jgi:MFS family permease